MSVRWDAAELARRELEVETEPEFLDWWISQSEDGYMKKVANPAGRVRVFRCETADDLLVPWAPPLGAL